MPFLSRQHSLNRASSNSSNSPSSQNGIRSLPGLPPFEAVENIPRKLKRRPPPPAEDAYRDDASPRSSLGGGGGGGSSIIRRMSHMFRPKRKSPPQNLNFNENMPKPGFMNKRGTMYIADSTRPRADSRSSIGDGEESEDDIRRPSGLGSAVSLDILPPSPSFLPKGDASDSHNLSEGIYARTRAVSSPNLLRSLSLKAKNKLRGGASRRNSVAQAALPSGSRKSTSSSTSPTKKKKKKKEKPRPPMDFPVEVLDLVLSHLPRRTVASLCPLSRSFCSAGRVNLYHKLDFDKLSPLQLQRLLALLASRRDLTELVQECICYTWPTFFSQPSHHTHNGDDEQQLKDRLLAATFTLALQRMSNLVKLTLPHFDHSLLAYHTAFGLRSLTFMSSTLTAEETSMLFTWLDGQINVTELRFPNLEDNPGTHKSHESPSQPDGASPGGAGSAPIHKHQPRQSVYLKPPTSALTTSPRHTPLTPSFPASSGSIDSRAASPSSISAIRQSLLGSATLLPLLTTLHATPALLSLLQPPSSSHAAVSSALELSSTLTACTQQMTRPLRKVTLNVSTTLYTGLRPNAVMASLRGSVEHLGVRFCENVDKRTVEKVLGAIGAILGSAPPPLPSVGGLGLGREGDSYDDDDDEMKDQAKNEWKGLLSLEISFRRMNALMPGMEETLYKTLHTTLPRYTHLQHLHLPFLSSQRFAKSLPSHPSKFKVTLLLSSKNKNHKQEYTTTNKENKRKSKVFKFPAPPPSPSTPPIPGVPSTSTTPTSSSRTREASYPLQATASPALCPSSSAIRGSPRPHDGPDPSGDEDDDDSHDQKLVSQDQVRVESWTRQCPSLRTVHLSGVSWVCYPGVPVVAGVRALPLLPSPSPTSTSTFTTWTSTSASTSDLSASMPTSSTLNSAGVAGEGSVLGSGSIDSAQRRSESATPPLHNPSPALSQTPSPSTSPTPPKTQPPSKPRSRSPSPNTATTPPPPVPPLPRIATQTLTKSKSAGALSSFVGGYGSPSSATSASSALNSALGSGSGSVSLSGSGSRLGSTPSGTSGSSASTPYSASLSGSRGVNGVGGGAGGTLRSRRSAQSMTVLTSTTYTPSSGVFVALNGDSGSSHASKANLSEGRAKSTLDGLGVRHKGSLASLLRSSSSLSLGLVNDK